VLAVVSTITLLALRIRKTSTKSESLRAHALPCNLFFRFKAFFISRAHFFFCSFKPFWVSWRFLIFCNKSLLPSMEDDPDPEALLGSDGAGIGDTETEDEAGADSGALSSAPEARPSAASLMAQTHKANQLGVSHRRFSCT